MNSYLNTPPATSRQSSASTMTKGGSSRAAPVEWRAQWWSPLAQMGALLACVAWIGAAIALWKRNFYLPLTYFEHLPGSTGGVLALDNSSYNTLISLISALVGAGIGFGMSQGIQSVLRRRMLHEGLSLYQFEAFVKYSRSAIQWELRWSALIAISLFALASCFGPASQAAFGASIDRFSFQVPLRFARITDNVDMTNSIIQSLQTLSQAGSDAGEQEFNFANALQALSGPDFSAVATVYNVKEVTNSTSPLYSVQWINQIMNHVAPPNYTLPLSKQQERLLAGAPATAVARALVEGFKSTVTCAMADINYMRTLSTDGTLANYVLEFPCGNRSVQYDASNDLVFDTYACTDGTPSIYVFGGDPSLSRNSLQACYRCDVTASSEMVPIKFSAAVQGADTTGAGQSESAIPPSVKLVAYLGNDLLNNFGSKGWRGLQGQIILAQSQKQDIGAFLEVGLATVVKASLARLSHFLTMEVETNAVPGFNWSYTYGQIDVQALKLHLSTIQLGWLLVPLLMVFLLLHLLVHHLRFNSGQVDFTDPSAMALIGLGSERDESVEGGTTGKFATEDSKARLHDVKFVYGVAPSLHGQGQADRLMLTTTGWTNSQRMTLNAPGKGRTFV